MGKKSFSEGVKNKPSPGRQEESEINQGGKDNKVYQMEDNRSRIRFTEESIEIDYHYTKIVRSLETETAT